MTGPTRGRGGGGGGFEAPGRRNSIQFLIASILGVKDGGGQPTFPKAPPSHAPSQKRSPRDLYPWMGSRTGSSSHTWLPARVRLGSGKELLFDATYSSDPSPICCSTAIASVISRVIGCSPLRRSQIRHLQNCSHSVELIVECGQVGQQLAILSADFGLEVWRKGALKVFEATVQNARASSSEMGYSFDVRKGGTSCQLDMGKEQLVFLSSAYLALQKESTRSWHRNRKSLTS